MRRPRFRRRKTNRGGAQAFRLGPLLMSYQRGVNAAMARVRIRCATRSLAGRLCVNPSASVSSARRLTASFAALTAAHPLSWCGGVLASASALGSAVRTSLLSGIHCLIAILAGTASGTSPLAGS